MSKLRAIEASFHKRTYMKTSVVVLNKLEEFNPELPTKRNWWTHHVTMKIYPRGGLYQLGELDRFTTSIASMTALRPQTPFSMSQGVANFALLSCDEPVGICGGAESPYMRIDDPDIKLPDVFTEGIRYFDHVEIPKETALWRRIKVYVYPDRHYAQRALGGIDITRTTHCITKSESFKQPKFR